MNDVGYDMSSLRQNTIPDSAERVSISQAVSEAEAHLDALSSGPHDAEHVQQLRRHIEVLSSRLAPIRRLPPEILSSIFIDPSLHTSISRGAYSLAGRGLDPITAVSFHWRSTALSTPRFWSILTISLAGKDNVIHLLRLYLERSKSCPLSLEIRAVDHVNESLLGALLDSCERWSILHLHMHPRYLSLFLPVRGKLASLEKLTLRASDINHMVGATNSVSISDAFELAPRLSRLEVSSMIPDGMLPRLPLAQIKTLVTASHFISFATRCPNLVDLSCTSASAENLSQPHVTTDARTLSVFPALLPDMTTPKLDYLHLVGGGRPWSSPQFSSFVKRSQLNLHTLVVDRVVIRGNDFLDLFPLLPTLQSLILRSLRPHALTDKVMRALTLADQALPSLVDLSVSGSYIFTNAALLDMLDARPSLQRIKLHLEHRAFGGEQLARLRALRDDGVWISVKCLNVDKQYVTMV
ncbi:hypothetical protein C8R44DRAFT_223341 [Mycena epipterygia]|nr:hypothetical protein C8R44DRAFT_223341 [Mycena epipterygia]